MTQTSRIAADNLEGLASSQSVYTTYIVFAVLPPF